MVKEGVKKDALSISIKEGSASSIASGLGDSFITPFALTITPEANQGIVVGMLSSFSILLGEISQLKGSKLIKDHPRKSIVRSFILIQALLWLPIAALSFFVWSGLLTGLLPYLLITFYSLIAIAGGLHYPAWFSWMGDLVPEKQRGKYFSKRNLIIGITGLSVALLGGIILEYFKNQKIVLVGFSIIFFLAFVFRTISYSYLKNQYAPKDGYKKEEQISLKEFFKKYKQFSKFGIYQSFFNMAIMIASPFFAVYMLKELHFNYITFIVVSISSTAFYLLFLPSVGKFSDLYGNKNLLIIANIAFALNPLLWIFLKNPIALVAVQAIAGLGNAALNIAVTNYTYSSISDKNRGSGIAYTNLFIGLGTFVGALSGGIMLNYLEISFMNIYFFVFITAVVARSLVAIIFLPQLNEPMNVKRIPYLHSTITHPFKSVNNNIHSFYKITEKNYTKGLKIWKNY